MTPLGLSSLQSPLRLAWAAWGLLSAGDKTWDRKICYKWKCPSSPATTGSRSQPTLALHWLREERSEAVRILVKLTSSANNGSRQTSTMKVRKLVFWSERNVKTNWTLSQCLWMFLNYSSVFWHFEVDCYVWLLLTPSPHLSWCHCLVLTCCCCLGSLAGGKPHNDRHI